jgi:hypothetical protein
MSLWQRAKEQSCRGSRVASWYSFKQKIPIWVNFGGPGNGKVWYILWPFGNLVAVWFIYPRFGTLCQEKSGNHGRNCRHWGGGANKLFVRNASDGFTYFGVYDVFQSVALEEFFAQKVGVFKGMYTFMYVQVGYRCFF